MHSRFSCLAGAFFALASVYGAEQHAPQTIQVVSGQVKLVRETNPKRYVGTVEAIEEVNIVPRVTGELRKICFSEGDMVKKGDLLYVIEDTTYRAAVEGLKAQKEQLKAALLYATNEYKRSTELLKTKAVAVSAHDKALMEIDMAKGKIKQIDASLLDAENNLSYTEIRAAISGRIGKSSVTTGNLLTPAGGSIANITQISPIYVRFSLSENVFRRDFGSIENLKKNAVIRVRLADGSLFGETGKVALLDNKVSATTNTVTIWAVFPNTRKESLLIPGGFVTVLVSIRSGKPLPAVMPSALITMQEGYGIYVIDTQNKVSLRRVVAGNQAGELRTILKGLSGNEKIVVDGTHKIHTGDTVAPVPVEKLK